MSYRSANTVMPALLSTFLLFSLISCSRFFIPVKETTDNPSAAGQYISASNQQKYFIIRTGNASYHLDNIIVDNISMTLSGRLSAVDKNHRLYINPANQNFKYKDDQAGSVLNEVHIFVYDTNHIDSLGAWRIPLNQISRIEVIQHDKKRTTSSYVLGGIGIGLGVLVLAGVIIALTKSSCPFVSVLDNGQYTLQGELFGGAVNKALEREDYLPLRAAPVNNRYVIRISNELKERQYTNFADLLLVEHPVNTQVLLDEYGQVVTIQQRQQPVMARLNQTDRLKEISGRDHLYCAFDDSTALTGINELCLQFKRAQPSSGGKLLLHLKNSYWFDYLYGEFTRKFGGSYAAWQEKQKKKPAAEMIRWAQEQYIPLRISVKTDTGWKEIRHLSSVGPLANRDVVIPFSLTELTGENIEIKISTGFMFWELDYAAMDFSANGAYTINRLHSVTAVDQNNVSVMREISARDSSYLQQAEVGEYADLSYEWNQSASAGYMYSVFLHTSGYYEPIRTYTGKPDLAALNSFREPGALARFSLDRYRKIPAEQSIIALNQ